VIANGSTSTFGFGYRRKRAMSFGAISVTAETDCSLAAPLSIAAVTGKAFSVGL